VVGNYGEVFQDFGYAHVANREPKLIYAKMTVRSGEDNEDWFGMSRRRYIL